MEGNLLAEECDDALGRIAIAKVKQLEREILEQLKKGVEAEQSKLYKLMQERLQEEVHAKAAILRANDALLLRARENLSNLDYSVSELLEEGSHVHQESLFTAMASRNKCEQNVNKLAKISRQMREATSRSQEN